MPRAARIKDMESIYHIMCKRADDVPLFGDDEDRVKYLSLVKKYQKRHLFKAYGYCVMTTHVHMIIDCNGADISKIMHGINLRYARYFNFKYNRHGHVFQDRFKSKIVKDDNYLITLSAYIHNNPKDIKGYENCVEKYKFSSLGIYLGLCKDPFRIIDEDFVMSLFSKNVKKARRSYLLKVYKALNIEEMDDVEFKNEKSEYRSGRVILSRSFSPEDVCRFVASITKVHEDFIHLKRIRRATESKALCALLMRCVCNFSYGEICSTLGGISIGRVAELCNLGMELVETRTEYGNILKRFIAFAKAA